MGNRWIINIMDKIGFSCYDVVDILEVVDLGDSFNLITGRGDMWLEKDYCNIRGNGIIEYSTDYINIYMERIDDGESVSIAA